MPPGWISANLDKSYTIESTMTHCHTEGSSCISLIDSRRIAKSTTHNVSFLVMLCHFLARISLQWLTLGHDCLVHGLGRSGGRGSTGGLGRGHDVVSVVW